MSPPAPRSDLDARVAASPLLHTMRTMARDKRALRLKQKKRRRQLAQSRTGQVDFAAAWPLTSCVMSDDWDQYGTLVQIAVTRTRRPDDPHSDCAVGVFLVDPGCLGVKDGFAKIATRAERREIIEGISRMSPLSEVSPDLAMKVIRDATVYAADLGFAPHPDARAPLTLLHDADPSAATEEVPLGSDDGKPFYVSGPNDDAGKICRQLQARLGPDGFHYATMAM